MIRSLAAFVAATAAASVLVTAVATPASAATWKPTWSRTSATASATITLDPVGIRLSTHVSVRRKDAAVKRVRATATAPGGQHIDTTLSLVKGKGNSTRSGTWRGVLTVPPQSPAGRWSVGLTATSTRGRTSSKAAAAAFTITKTPPPALAVSPSPVVVGTAGTAVTVQAFWDRHVDGAYATLTAPGGTAVNGNMSRIGGNPDWGLWRTSPTLPANSRPGKWTLTTQYVSGGVWTGGPSTVLTVRQHSAVSLKASKKKVKKGRRVTLSGGLSAYREDGTWGGLSKQKLDVYFLWRAAGAKWTKFATITTNGTGRYSYAPYMARSGTFEVRYAGAGLFDGSTSPGVAITVT